MLVVLALFACADDPASNDAKKPDRTVVDETTATTELPDELTPGEHVVDPEPDGTPLTIAEVELGLAEAMEVLLAWDPRLTLEAYGAAIAHEDDYCPYYYDFYFDNYGYYYWEDVCTTGTGAEFDGYFVGIDYGASSDGTYAYGSNGWYYGDFSIDTPDEQKLEFAGNYYGYDYMYLPGDWSYYYYTMFGTLAWHGSEYNDTWVGDSLGVSLVSWGSGYYDGGEIYVHGGISGYDGVTNTAEFADVWLAPQNVTGICDLEPGGMISLRDGEGGWYDVEFQGPTGWGDALFEPLCDGCGDVWHDGQLLGQACADFSKLYEWGVRPWD